MAQARLILARIIVLVLFKGCSSAQVEVEPHEALVIPGQNLTVMCRVAVPLQYCRVELPGMQALNLQPKLIDNDVSYYGQGLTAGQCGFILHRVSDRNNGEVRCFLGIETEAKESVASMRLIVARAPKTPELDLSTGAEGPGIYRLDETLKASCMVRDGRPVANLSWYLNDEPIYKDGLSMPTVIDLAKENLQSKLQNLTRTVQASDNGKYLRCVAYHPAYVTGMAETKREIRVKYPPLPQREIDRFGYNIGKTGVISVEIEANPRPIVTWDIGGERISEGNHDQTGRIEAEPGQDLGRGRFNYSLRIAAINKHDTEKMYVLRAYNNMGEADYVVKISTSPEPEGVDLGVGGIIGIVVSILIILLVIFILAFAKVTGRWCFSERHGGRTLGETSDTESADISRPKSTKFIPTSFRRIFIKEQENLREEEESPKESKNLEVDEVKLDTEPQKDVLVYAELDLVSPNKQVVKPEEEKTEYAEIVYTPSGEVQTQSQSVKKD